MILDEYNFSFNHLMASVKENREMEIGTLVFTIDLKQCPKLGNWHSDHLGLVGLKIV